jgi:hypothetical protein
VAREGKADGGSDAASIRRTAAAVGGGLASVVLAACATAAPLSDGPVYLDVASVEDLSHGCENVRDGYPDAAKYAGDGPHTIVVFAKDLVTDTGNLPDYQLANSEAPDGMLAKPDSELRTGRVLDTLQLESQMRQPASSCPLSIEGGSRIYATAQPYELDNLLKDLVTSPPR